MGGLIIKSPNWVEDQTMISTKRNLQDKLRVKKTCAPNPRSRVQNWTVVTKLPLCKPSIYVGVAEVTVVRVHLGGSFIPYYKYWLDTGFFGLFYSNFHKSLKALSKIEALIWISFWRALIFQPFNSKGWLKSKTSIQENRNEIQNSY